eukprot:1157442-Pelagomonas_calceolata.AAC.4
MYPLTCIVAQGTSVCSCISCTVQQLIQLLKGMGYICLVHLHRQEQCSYPAVTHDCNYIAEGSKYMQLFFTNRRFQGK